MNGFQWWENLCRTPYLCAQKLTQKDVIAQWYSEGCVCIIGGGGETTTFNEFFPPLTELCFKMIGKPVSRFFCEELMGAKKIESYFNSIKSYILVWCCPHEWIAEMSKTYAGRLACPENSPEKDVLLRSDMLKGCVLWRGVGGQQQQHFTWKFYPPLWRNWAFYEL